MNAQVCIFNFGCNQPFSSKNNCETSSYHRKTYTTFGKIFPQCRSFHFQQSSKANFRLSHPCLWRRVRIFPGVNLLPSQVSPGPYVSEQFVNCIQYVATSHFLHHFLQSVESFSSSSVILLHPYSFVFPSHCHLLLIQCLPLHSTVLFYLLRLHHFPILPYPHFLQLLLTHCQNL